MGSERSERRGGMVKVRFAPSPTGFLHIGGARTALFNWLFARHNNGVFILRIEDTDKKRSKDEYLDEILESLSWLGLNWDEIHFQSERFSIYKEHAMRLVKENKARRKEGAIIFKIPLKKIKVGDLIHGEIEFDTSLIKDQVLIKSDGTPTYNFACVIDDATLGITQVIRGDDHISNTPKQILLYEALGFKIPQFAHLPLILAKGGGRLSKRTGATAISDYRKTGFLPEALVNYLLLLGWSPGGDQELIEIEEAAKRFSIEKANKTAAIFDLEKLNWINSQYIKKADSEKLMDLIVPTLIKKRLLQKDFDRNWLLNLIRLFQGRMNTLADFVEWADFFFLKRIKYEKEAANKFLKQDLSREFNLLSERLMSLSSFDPLIIEQSFRNLVAELKMDTRDLIHPVRVALTGKTIGPGLFEVISLLGKERVKERLLKFGRDRISTKNERK
jgi:glutamyl-tRNA synthetase